MGKGVEIKCKHCSNEIVIDLGPGFTTEVKVLFIEEGLKSFVLWHHPEETYEEGEYEKYLTEGWIEVVDEEELKRFLPHIRCEVCGNIGFEYGKEEL